MAFPAVILDWFVEPTDAEPYQPRVVEALLTPGWTMTWPEAHRLLIRAGYGPGTPEHLTPWARAELLGGYRNLECDCCGNGGPHSVRLFHREADLCGVVSCSVCNRACEI